MTNLVPLKHRLSPCLVGAAISLLAAFVFAYSATAHTPLAPGATGFSPPAKLDLKQLQDAARKATNTNTAIRTIPVRTTLNQR